MKINRQEEANKNEFSPPLRMGANIFSYIFHPLFIPVYVFYFLAFIHPSYFSGFGLHGKTRLLFTVVLNLVFFPLITVLLLKGLGFIESFFLKTQQDRIIPYIASGIFFFWGYQVFKNQPEVPPILTSFTFAVFLSSSAALMANIYCKISMHAIGVGGIVGLFILIMQQNTMLMTVPLFIAILITGIVCTSRLIVSDHTQKEIYLGLIIGILSQLVASLVVL